MSKNIVLLSDGTGNSSAKLFKTNVWRLFQILDLRDPNSQIAYYDDGVGTSSFKWWAAFTGVFGIGLKRNVIAIYGFCCRNYQPGDHIYCFGFSRGSFTVRVVAGMIAHQGLVKYEKNNEADLARHAADAYRLYRRRFTGGLFTGGLGFDVRALRDLAIRQWRKFRNQSAPPPTTVESIHFVGLWDTVDAYGGPIQEMTRAIDYWIWPLSMPDRFMSAKVYKACQALALEDERAAFKPVIWDQRYVRGTDKSIAPGKTEWLFGINHDPRSAAAQAVTPPPHSRTDLSLIDRERISQVWFTGVHADIGGGYPEDGLSYVTFDWMLDRAKAYGLKYFDKQRELLIDPQINPYDKLNDSRKGFAGYYRYKPRNILELYSEPPYRPSIFDDARCMWRLLWNIPDPQSEIRADLHPTMRALEGQETEVLPPPPAIIHEAVFDRIKYGTDRYAPVVIPKFYHFTDKAGMITNALHPMDPADPRSDVQDDVWNWIWLRRVVYFLTAFATLFVASIPVFVIYAPDFGRSKVGGLVVPIVNAAESFLPKFLEPWFVAFRNGPGFLLAGVFAVGAFMFLGANLQRTIRDVARVAWHSPDDHKVLTGWRSAVYQLRRFGLYKATFYWLSHWVFPTAIMFWLFSWLAFGTANTLGLICKEEKDAIEVTSSATDPKPAASPTSDGAKPVMMKTRNVCNPTGMKVTQDETYQVTLTVGDLWLDRKMPTDPNGFNLRRASWLQNLFGWYHRRLVWSNWFATILRVGGPGFEEHVLDLRQKDPSDKKSPWIAEFKPRSNGEVFLYVNDTVIGLPWIYDLFYWNNQGTAVVKLEKVAARKPPS